MSELKNSKKSRSSGVRSGKGAKAPADARAAADQAERDDFVAGSGRPQGRKFWGTSFFLIAVIVALANIAHIFADRHYDELKALGGASGMTSWAWIAIAIAGGTAVLAAFLLVVRWKRAVDLFASLEFASATTLLVMVATIAGTLILQKAPVEKFDAFYGGAADVLRALHVADLFHSFWFMALLALVALSLLVDAALRVRDLVVRKPGAWRKAGFVLTHGGIVVVLVGGLLSMLYGDKGMVDLTKGMTAERYVRYADALGPGEERVGELGFGIRLDDFELEYYEPAYSVYLFTEDGTREDGQPDYKAVGALDPAKKERWSFGDGYELAVKDFEQPEPGAKAGASHEIVIDGQRRVAVKVGDVVPIASGVTLRVDKYLPHFNFDLQSKTAVSASDRPENPTLEVTVMRDGEAPSRTWLFANNPGFSMGGHGGKGDDLAKRVTYRLRRAEVVLELSQHDKVLTPPEGARLALGGSTALFPQGVWFVSFHEKGDRIKQYHSTVSIIDGGKVAVERAPLSVNSPIAYGDFHLYQSNYRAWDLNYSGIQVVKDPGLTAVYAGMILMMLGVFYVLYFRRRLKRMTGGDADAGKANRAADAEDGGSSPPQKASAAGGV